MSTSWVSQPTLREMAATPSGRDASPDTRWRQASLRLLGAAAWAEEVAGKDAGVKLAVASKGGGASEKPTARVSHKFLRRHGNIGPVSIKTSWPACFCPCPCPSRCCGPSDWPPGSSPSPGGPFFSKWHNGGRIQSGSQRRNRRRGCNHKNCCRRTYEGSHVGPGREPLPPRLMDEGPCGRETLCERSSLRPCLSCAQGPPWRGGAPARRLAETTAPSDKSSDSD